MYNDKQLVRITVFILLVGIVLVYAVFFNTQGDSLATQAAHVIQKRLSSDDTTTSGNTLSTGLAVLTGDISS